MHGFRMSESQEEQLHLWHLFADAMARRAPVEVTFFKSKMITHTYVEHGETKTITYPGFVRVTRTVEPHGFGADWTKGTRWVKVVDRNPEGVGSRPAYRTIRLDRVAVNSRTGRPLATRRLSIGYLCPSLLDHKPLHPTKGQLVGAAA